LSTVPRLAWPLTQAAIQWIRRFFLWDYVDGACSYPLTCIYLWV